METDSEPSGRNSGCAGAFLFHAERRSFRYCPLAPKSCYVRLDDIGRCVRRLESWQSHGRWQESFAGISEVWAKAKSDERLEISWFNAFSKFRSGLFLPKSDRKFCRSQSLNLGCIFVLLDREGYTTATSYSTLLRESQILHEFADKAQAKQCRPQMAGRSWTTGGGGVECEDLGSR